MQSAACKIKEHFSELFSPHIPADQRQRLNETIQELQYVAGSYALVPFTSDEIESALGKAKLGKTSGISGVSYELLVAIWCLPEGRDILIAFVNDLLESPDHPLELRDGFVALVPKVSHVMHPQDIRPINLIEASNKLFCALLLSRLVVHWPAPFVQFGGLQGGQVADALAAAN